MLYKQANRNSKKSITSTSFLIFIALSATVEANEPEMYRADPNLFDDQTLNLPTEGKSGNFQYEIIQGVAVFEGDILLGRVNADGSLPPKITPRGLGRSDLFGRWPDGIVPYFIPLNATNTQRERINEAVLHWTSKTTLSFIEQTAENEDLYPNFITFEPTNSCASYVGMQGGDQPILISDACSVGSVIHEIGHALGLFHEHTRPDRDNFVQVNWDQIVSGKEINFEVLDAGAQNYGAYDYGSIMQYGEYFFSASGEPTIVAPEGFDIGQRESLSALDIQSINDMYATDLALFQPDINTTEAGVEIGIGIANQGELGAQQLLLVAAVSENTEWQGISPDSGWDCLTAETELRCTRDTLAEQEETNFTVLMSSSSNEAHDISIRLSSRTIDTDLTNNSFNDDQMEEIPAVIKEQSVTVDAQVTLPKEPEVVELDTDEEAVALTPVQTDSEPVAAAASAVASPSAGSDNGFLVILFGLGLIWYRGPKSEVKRNQP